jgi:hypothetical protein
MVTPLWHYTKGRRRPSRVAHYLAHVEVAALGRGVLESFLVDAAVPPVHGVGGHGLDATGNTNIVIASLEEKSHLSTQSRRPTHTPRLLERVYLDGRSDVGDGLEARRALAVDGGARDNVGQTRKQGSNAHFSGTLERERENEKASPNGGGSKARCESSPN